MTKLKHTRAYKHNRSGITIEPAVYYGHFSNQLDEPQSNRYHFVIVSGDASIIERRANALRQILSPVEDYAMSRVEKLKASGFKHAAMTLITRFNPAYLGQGWVQFENCPLIRLDSLDSKLQQDLPLILKRFGRSLEPVS